MNQDIFNDARRLIGAAVRGLSARQGDGVAEVLSRLQAQDLGPASFHAPDPQGLPVLAHLPPCIGETMLLDPDIAAALASVEDALHWRQTPAYTDERLGAGFTANYGWAQVIGPHGFFAGDDLLLGFLLLGPERHYPDHYHPAPELYWTLTSGSLWSRDGGPFEEAAQGATIWHPPMTVHATRTAASPLLALWCWTRDTATSARLKDA